jgi:hypothetical protein
LFLAKLVLCANHCSAIIVMPGHVVSEACQEEVMQFKISFNKNIYRNKRIGERRGGRQ